MRRQRLSLEALIAWQQMRRPVIHVIFCALCIQTPERSLLDAVEYSKAHNGSLLAACTSVMIKMDVNVYLVDSRTLLR